MSENNLSIDSFLQKPIAKNDEGATLFFTTHMSFEADVRRVVKILSEKKFIKEKPFMIRIEC